MKACQKDYSWGLIKEGGKVHAFCVGGRAICNCKKAKLKGIKEPEQKDICLICQSIIKGKDWGWAGEGDSIDGYEGYNYY